MAEGIALITGTETREWAYVAMSRGRDGNYAYVATEPARVADPKPGVRPAPELDRHERIERERAGLPEPEQQEPSELAREPIAVLSDVLENEGAELSALEVQRRNLANADHLANCTPSGRARPPTRSPAGTSACSVSSCPRSTRTRNCPGTLPGCAGRCAAPRRLGWTPATSSPGRSPPSR